MTVGTTNWQNKIYSPSRQMQTVHSSHRHSPRTESLRICVHPEAAATDWWRTEFIILNGKIEYRGNDGDQERVQGKAGQKAYLNFSDNTGKVE